MPLGGERCPAGDITSPVQNRNNYAVLSRWRVHVRAGSSRTVQERSRLVGTPLTQRPEFLFTLHSAHVGPATRARARARPPKKRNPGALAGATGADRRAFAGSSERKHRSIILSKNQPASLSSRE